MGETRKFKDMDFKELATSDGEIEATVGFYQARMVVKGEFLIEKPEGAWKFPSQLLFVVWTPEEVKIEKRVENTDYNRVEIAVPLEKGKEMLRKALSKLESLTGRTPET